MLLRTASCAWPATTRVVPSSTLGTPAPLLPGLCLHRAQVFLYNRSTVVDWAIYGKPINDWLLSKVGAPCRAQYPEACGGLQELPAQPYPLLSGR